MHPQTRFIVSCVVDSIAIESSYQRQVVVDDHACILDILDTAGQDDYSVRPASRPSALVRALTNGVQALRSQWIRSGEGYIIMYSITDKSTFAEVCTCPPLRPAYGGSGQKTQCNSY